MGVTLSQIANNTAHVTFSVNGENVNVTYYPGRVTEKTIATLNSFASMDQASMASGFESFNEMLAGLIKEWDVLDDSVEPAVMFPLDAKRFAELPFGFRMQVVGVIMSDIRPETIAPQIQS